MLLRRWSIAAELAHENILITVFIPDPLYVGLGAFEVAAVFMGVDGLPS